MIPEPTSAGALILHIAFVLARFVFLMTLLLWSMSRILRWLLATNDEADIE